MRTREEQIADIFPGFCAEDAEATITKGDLRLMLDHAERQGAEEQQRKDAEMQEPAYYIDHRGTFSSSAFPFAVKSLSECDFIDTAEPVYRRPANVAAMEVRVKVLEAVLDGIQVYCGDTLAGPVGRDGDRSWFRDGVEEVFRRARAALTRGMGG